MVKIKDAGKIEAAWKEISNEGKTSWMAIGYCGKEEVELTGSGTGGYDNFVKQLGDDVVFGAFRVYGLDQDGESKRLKLISVTYIPDSIKGLKRARCGPHRGDVLKLFKGSHIDVEASNVDDISKDFLVKRLNSSTGSHKPASYIWTDGNDEETPQEEAPQEEEAQEEEAQEEEAQEEEAQEEEAQDE